MDVCGQKLFLAVLFEEMNHDEYYDKMADWKLREYEERVRVAEGRVLDLAYFGGENAVNLKVPYSLALSFCI